MPLLNFHSKAIKKMSKAMAYSEIEKANHTLKTNVLF